MRLFIGIPIEDNLRTGIINLYNRFKGHENLKLTEKENLHITLNFLGEAAENKLEPVQQAMDEALAGVEPFFITTNMIATFGSEIHARVIWANVDKHGERIIEMFEKLEEKLLPLGFEKETRAFTPHITMGRSKEGVDVLRTLRDIKFEYKSKVTGVALYHSGTTHVGAKYKVLYERKLTT